jgi:hypothetical protein
MEERGMERREGVKETEERGERRVREERERVKGGMG